MAVDYSPVTESPGNRVRREAIDMLWTRYAYAADLSDGKDVLEVGCGPGSGLGYLAARARRVVGADYTEKLVSLARRHYCDRVPLLRLDGQALPFGGGSFDLVLLFEALYYLRDQARFVSEAQRVLRPSGRLIIVSANPKWSDFNPSPFSTKYLDSEETRALMESGGFDTIVQGAFRANLATVRDKATSLAKRAAVRLGVMPKTMKGKEGLKRILFGRLEDFPAEVSAGMGSYHSPELIPAGAPCTNFKVLFAVGKRP